MSFHDDIAFVVLNYNIIKETRECVESIKRNIDTPNFHIVIVDNCSPNGVGHDLEEEYKDDSKVLVHITNANLGFAKGNNIGIDIARKIYNPKFICCLNNDTVFIQNDYVSTLNKIYEEHKYAVIGPKVYLRDDSVQPLCGYLKSKSYYKNELMRARGTGLQGLYQHFKNVLKKVSVVKYAYRYLKNKRSISNPACPYKNIILHGCCLVFTPAFFEKLAGFNNKTFLYVEEEILYVSLLQKGLENYYCPDLVIKHLEDVSTDSTIKLSSEKQKFLDKNRAASLEVLIKELEKYEKEG